MQCFTMCVEQQVKMLNFKFQNFDFDSSDIIENNNCHEYF